MRIPGPIGEETEALENPFVVLLSTNEALRFKAWEEVKGYYREHARRMQTDAFEARYFILDHGNWSEVAHPALVN
jgi:hypothetical protein